MLALAFLILVGTQLHWSPMRCIFHIPRGLRLFRDRLLARGRSPQSSLRQARFAERRPPRWRNNGKSDTPKPRVQCAPNLKPHNARDRLTPRSCGECSGPGLTITGAADDDPSGIATYSQAGAQFGYAPQHGRCCSPCRSWARSRSSAPASAGRRARASRPTSRKQLHAALAVLYGSDRAAGGGQYH